MQAEPLLKITDVGHEFLFFVSLLLSTGAVGFRFGVLRSRASASAATGALPGEPDIFGEAAARAATLGLIGALGQVVFWWLGVQGLAERRSTTFAAAFAAGGLPTLIQVAGLALLVLGFILAVRRIGAGWVMAGIGMLMIPFRGIVTGKWSQLVNPLHMLAAGLWIGTLFILVVVGIGIAFRRDMPGDRRGRTVADMVHAFSPLALGSVALLVVMGVLTAKSHLKYWAALWTTPYGYAFDAKMALVLIVLALGAWNWRRVRPTLGQEAGAAVVRRTATTELLVAGLVLVVTAVLVSLPSPRLPGARSPGGEGGPPPAATAPASPAPSPAGG